MCDGKLNPIQRWDIAATLADKLGKEVDLVDLISASTVMQHQITYQGICLYDPLNIADSYAIRVLSMYHDLNIERADNSKSFCETIQKYLQRITTTYQAAGDEFATDYDRQDSVILNLQRTCQACIDLANYTARKQ